MRKLLLLLISTLLFCSNIYADDIKLPHITVFGTATTKVSPDITNWNLSVKNHGGKLRDVASQHTEIIESVLKLIKDKKVNSSKLQTSRMEFGENLKYIDGTKVKEGYYASTAISFELEDLNKYKEIWVSLSDISHVSVKSVTYSSSDQIEIQNSTRKKALLAAKEKAASLANAIGSGIGEPLLIEEVISQDLSAFNMFSNSEHLEGDSSQGQAGIAPGEIAIKMRVKVTFRLVTTDGQR
jgi:uncharacterized protein YggE